MEAGSHKESPPHFPAQFPVAKAPDPLRSSDSLSSRSGEWKAVGISPGVSLELRPWVSKKSTCSRVRRTLLEGASAIR